MVAAEGRDRLIKRVRAWFVLGSFLVSGLTVVVACSGDKPPAQNNDELVRANELITDGQYSEAIFILDARVKSSPGDEKARVLLASGYAARAGLMLTRYLSFADQVVKWGQVDDLLPTAGESGGAALQALSEVAGAAVKIELVIKAFSALPTPTGDDQIADLKLAVKTLGDGGVLHAGPAIYRALLKTVVLKIDLAGRFKLNTSVACEIASGELGQWFTSIDSEIQSILLDVANGLGDASSAEKVRAKATDIKTTVDQVAVILSAPDLITQTLHMPPPLVDAFGACK